MVMILTIRSNVRQVERDLDRLAMEQIPFAQTLAVNSLAAMVAKAEADEILKEFPSATPFTLKSVKVRRGRKSDPSATVFLGQIAEQYLAPYISGGRHFLGSKRGILNPKAIQLNRFGNIAKGRLGQLKNRPDVFVGSIKKKNGETINGVFQRGNFVVGRRRTGGIPSKVKIKPQRYRLKILIRFGDALTVTERLPWFETATGILNTNAQTEMDKAMKTALSTAKP